MKMLTVLLIFHIGLICGIVCDVEFSNELKRVSSNKIFITKFKRGIDIFHGRKYVKKTPDNKLGTNQIIQKHSFKAKKPDPKQFTAFGPIIKNEGKSYNMIKYLSVPESPYFPLDDHLDKIKQKKVLPSFLGSIIRNRRSADEKKRTQSQAQPSRRLIAARDATIEEYPYVVSIQKSGEHWCAGAILNPRLCISTANCFWKSKQLSSLLIRAGSRYTNKGGQMAKIQEVMKHPNFNIRRHPDCDVALFVLDRDLRFSHSLHGVDLPNPLMVPPFKDAWVTGFGSERRDGMYEPRSSALHVYRSEVMDRGVCNNITRRFGVGVTGNFLCLYQNNKRAPCTRDTGAPAVSDGVLWGLASWGIRKLCGTERFPAMFSYIASPAIMEFIMNATTFLMSDHRHFPFYAPFESKEIKTADDDIPETTTEF